MLIENAFTVAKPLDQVWDYLLDVHKVAPCMPGAELTETIDDRNWKGTLTMKFGPVSMSFVGSVTLEERDDAAHRVVLHAKGSEQRGKGAADATVTSWLEAVDAGTAVKMQADMTLTGAAAQLSRGLLPEVSKRLTQQFADCLEQRLGAAAGAGEPVGAATLSSAAAVPNPVGGIRLGLAATWSVIVSFFRRLFGSSKSPRA
ncbi:MAG: carbon monoxide dehydrogenase [Actinobacteria bacterium]|nr:MAG: carbon monoxide dehydrogenase [Actinomycetota bacterium]